MMGYANKEQKTLRVHLLAIQATCWHNPLSQARVLWRLLSWARVQARALWHKKLGYKMIQGLCEWLILESLVKPIVFVL